MIVYFKATCWYCKEDKECRVYGIALACDDCIKKATAHAMGDE